MAEYREVAISDDPIVPCLACEECGAYVWRIDLHEKFHDAVDTMAFVVRTMEISESMRRSD